MTSILNKIRVLKKLYNKTQIIREELQARNIEFNQLSYAQIGAILDELSAEHEILTGRQNAITEAEIISAATQHIREQPWSPGDGYVISFVENEDHRKERMEREHQEKTRYENESILNEYDARLRQEDMENENNGSFRIDPAINFVDRHFGESSDIYNIDDIPRASVIHAYEDDENDEGLENIVDAHGIPVHELQIVQNNLPGDYNELLALDSEDEIPVNELPGPIFFGEENYK